MPPRLINLVQDLRRVAPSARIEMSVLPSGVVFLNVFPGAREFVLEYSPANGWGVSENDENTPPFHIGHDEVFDLADEAAEHLIKLVAESLKAPSVAAA